MTPIDLNRRTPLIPHTDRSTPIRQIFAALGMMTIEVRLVELKFQDRLEVCCCYTLDTGTHRCIDQREIACLY